MRATARDTADVALSVPLRRVVVDGMKITSRRRCDAKAAGVGPVAVLLGQIRTALMVTGLGQRADSLMLEGRSYVRTLDRDKVRAGDAPTLYLHAPDATPPELPGVAFAALPAHAGRLDLAAAMALLAARGVNEVQVEAGAALGGALWRAGLVDELLLYQAPQLLGDGARPLLAGLGIDHMADAVHLQLHDVRQVGADLRLLLRPRR